MRTKPDFSAGVVLFDGTRQVRGLELIVKADNIYALRPRRDRAPKVSYHASGQSHAKLEKAAPTFPMVDLPPKFLKERGIPLGTLPRPLFATSLENVATFLPYTGQLFDRRIEIRLPKTEGLLVLQLCIGGSSGQRWLYEERDYVEATVTERVFSGAGYEFCVRLAVLSSSPVFCRTIDEEMASAFLLASKDLGVRVLAPFSVQVTEDESLAFEAYLPDFGGPNGLVVGSLERDDGSDVRRRLGYASSDLSTRYRSYERQLFVDTLNDWGWSGHSDAQPPWYTGKPWA